MYRIRHALVLTLLLTLAQALVWLACNPQGSAPDAPHEVQGLAFSGYTRWQKPPAGDALPHHTVALHNRQAPDQLEQDLQRLRPYARHIRTYSALEWPDVAALAQTHGIGVTLGIWLSDNAQRNQAEMRTAFAAAQQYNNVEAVIVGNETQLQKRISLAQLTDALDAARKALSQPVSTAEPWHVWLETPQLAEHVDFITIHLLPYWEGVAVDKAVDEVFARYRQVQQRFPEKTIVIGETGWPSGGPDRGKAVASPNTQARFIREFLSRSGELDKQARNSQGQYARAQHTQAQHTPALHAQAHPAQASPIDAPGIQTSDIQASDIHTSGVHSGHTGMKHLPRYFLMEAIDQPWKVSIEGQAGAYWGFLDADRKQKFNLSGPLQPHLLAWSPWQMQAPPLWQIQALAACGIAALLCVVVLRKLGHLKHRAQMTVGVVMQLTGAGLALMFTQPLTHYFTPASLAVWALMLLPTMLMALVLIAQTLEFADTYWDGQLRFAAKPKPWGPKSPAQTNNVTDDSTHDSTHDSADAPTDNPTDTATDAASNNRHLADVGQPQPLVSIHVACSNEPPQMVIETLQSLLNLRWQNLEIIVVDNNTTDDGCWMPVRDFLIDLASQQLTTSNASAISNASASGDSYHLQVSLPTRRIHFQHEAVLSGFKAGALNLALELTHPDAAWIAVVDADYVVEPEWIASVGGYFDEPNIAIIQAPQTHRMSNNSLLERMMCAEYDTFFRIGMHHRHERNAIIQHGTMTLIRANTLRELRGWNTDCICEDTELGLRILATGARALYIDKPMGAGLLPANSHAYLRQRFRWACGAMQILRTHKRLIATGHTDELQEAELVKRARLPHRHSLTFAQRYHFVAGWLPWWGDTLHLFMTVAALLWSGGMLLAPHLFGAPTPFFMMAPLALLAFRLVAWPLLYRRRIGGGLAEWGGAALAGMALSHTIAKGILRGLVPKRAVFEVTVKSELGKQSQRLQPNELFPVHSSSVNKSMHQPMNQPVRQPASQESLLLCALLSSATLLAVLPAPAGADPLTQMAWLLMLVLQSLPYAATAHLHLHSGAG